MKSEAEKEYERLIRQAKEFQELYEQLTPWGKFEFMTLIYWTIGKRKIKEFPAKWVEFQIKLEREFELHGMPFALKLKLEKWFNYPPHKSDKYFLNQGRKIWYHCFVEEDNLEIHLYYRNQYPGYLWFQPEKDGTATIIGIHIREGFQKTGLGTAIFQEAITQLKGRISCIKGVLEKEYEKDIEASLRWLHRQGFETIEKDNGDYELIFWIR